jgi:hypothetical protein
VSKALLLAKTLFFFHNTLKELGTSVVEAKKKMGRRNNEKLRELQVDKGKKKPWGKRREKKTWGGEITRCCASRK